MAINTNKLVIEVVLEWPSLRVKLLLGPRKDNLIFLALRLVDVPVLASSAFLLNFAIPRGVVDADVEDHATTERRERKLLGEGFSKGLHRALELGVRILLRDCLEGRSRASANMEHVDGRWRLVSDLVGEFAL